MEYQNLKHVLCDENNTFNDNVFMQIVYTGLLPGKSSVAFMPMIDWKANDKTCIFLTILVVDDQAQNYNA